MDKIRARKEILARIRDFSGWSGIEIPSNLGYGYPIMLLDEKGEAFPWQKALDHLSIRQEHVNYLQSVFPVIKGNDTYAWQEGGRKRKELDEAIVALGFSPLQD